jgi:DNA topoisomerase VI subunit B
VSAQLLKRRTFSVSRAADFLEARALVSQTGQPEHRFGDVVVKELLDNALDACETAGVEPEITVTIETGGDVQRVTVADNGSGIPSGVVTRILDYSTLTSDKALYRSPCRGAQGNALKTIIGIPYALGVAYPVTVKAGGVRHVITVGLDPAGNVAVRHDREQSPRTAGTAFTVPLPADLDLDVAGWVSGYALVNPHASFTAAEHAHGGEDEDPEIYKATAGDGWRKPVPTDPTSPWWYGVTAFTKLAASLAVLGDDRPLGEFIKEFRGLSGTAKRKMVAYLVDLGVVFLLPVE